MSIVVYKVPSDWVPIVTEDGWEQPMLHCSILQYESHLRLFENCVAEMGEQGAIDYMGKPDQREYWPDWTREERTHYIAYCTTSGTSVSSVCATIEELAQSLVDSRVNVESNKPPTVDAWIEALREHPYFNPAVAAAPRVEAAPRFMASIWRY